MQLRTLNVGCLGGGTGLPSLLGGLKTNPWLAVHAIVTMFDSGGSSGQLRDELGVLPPGDVHALARAMQAFLADPQKAAARALRLRDTVRSRFALDTTTAAVLDFYGTLLPR